MNVHLEPYSEILTLLSRWGIGSKDAKGLEILALRKYDVHHLINAMSAILIYADTDVRFYGIDALPYLVPSEAVIDLLIPCLSDPSPDIRWTVCEALHDYPNPKVVLPLVKVLQEDENSDVRLVAAEALYAVGDERAIPALAYAEKHDKGKDYEDRTVAHAARQAITAIEKRKNER